MASTWHYLMREDRETLYLESSLDNTGGGFSQEPLPSIAYEVAVQGKLPFISNYLLYISLV